MKSGMLMTVIEGWIDQSGLEITDKVIGALKSELIAVHPKYYHHIKITKVLNGSGGIDYRLIVRFSKTSYYYVTNNYRQLKRIIDSLSVKRPKVTKSMKKSLKSQLSLGGY